MKEFMVRKNIRSALSSFLLLGWALLAPAAPARAAVSSVFVGLPGVQVPAEVITGPGSGPLMDKGDDPLVNDGDWQGTEAFVSYNQPWTPPVASFRARVRSCDDPTPFTSVCMDDFAFNVSGRAVRLRWWGVLTNTAQVGRPYYIAMYKDGDCKPATLIYKACVTPAVVSVQTDCTNQRVFRFDTAIPPVALSAGVRYWLQISEDDADSSHPGADDFFWSGRQPVRKCRALQTSDYITYTPLVDPCNGLPDDLSFAILLQTP